MKKVKNYKFKKYIKIFECVYNDEKFIKFGDIGIQNQKLHQHKRSISMKYIDICKIVVSNKISFNKKGFKYFNGYKDTKNIRPLYTFDS